MKNPKLDLLRKKLAMFALATSLSVTSLSGCSLALSEETIKKSIEYTSDFGRSAGLYKNSEGKWSIYFLKDDKYYDFKSYEYIGTAKYDTLCSNTYDYFYNKVGILYFGYLPFFYCNPYVTYTLDTVNNLDDADIEKLKNDFFEKSVFRVRDIKLFYIEKIDGSNKQVVIGYPVSKTEIFNFETWQFENYEGNVILEESCEFQNDWVYLSEALNYLNEKKNHPEDSRNQKCFETLKETEALEEKKEEVQEQEVEQESVAIEETAETENDVESDYEENEGYKILLLDAGSYLIRIKDNFTSKDLTKVLDFLVNQKDSIRGLIIDTDYNNPVIIEKILKEISINENIVELTLWGCKNLNLSDIVTMSHLKYLTLGQCTMENVTQLNQFTQIQYLYLSATVNDLNVISNLTQLHSLTIILSGKKELENIEILKKFEDLHFLSLINCNLSDVGVFCDLKHLVSLDLDGNPIQNLSELINMKSSPNIFLNNIADLSDLKSCIEELTEKGIDIYYYSNDNWDIITKESLEQEKLKLKLNE